VKNRVINKIREFRTRERLTQADLADVAGVSRQSIISIEKGQYIPSLPLALKFARIFRVSTDNLFQLREK